MKKRKPVIAWGIRELSGMLYAFTIRSTRRQCRSDFLRDRHDMPWKYARKHFTLCKLEIRNAK